MERSVIGVVLIVLAAVLAAVSLARFARRGAKEDVATRSLDAAWLLALAVGAVLAYRGAGPVVVTAAIVVAGGTLIWTERLAPLSLGEVVFRARRGPLHWLYFAGALAMGLNTLDILLTNWFTPVDFDFRRHALHPILGLALLSWGLGRLEIRTRGISLPDQPPLRWEDIVSYRWTGSQRRRLEIRRKKPAFLFGDVVRRTVRADERDRIEELLAVQVAGEEAGRPAAPEPTIGASVQG